MKFRLSLLACTIATLSQNTWAAGFALNEQSIKSMGMAQAGRASTASDATTLYANPAGLTQLAGTQLAGNVTYIYAPADIKNAQGSHNGTNDGDMIPPQPVGSGFMSHQLNEQLTVGIGNYAPFGLATNYEDAFQGRWFGDKSKVRVIAIQPTAAYKLNKDISVGLGLTVSRIDGFLSGAIAPLPTSNPTLEVEGNDTAFSYNIGVLWQVQPHTKVGFDYRSKTKYNLTGTTEVRDLPTKGKVDYYNASLDIATPANIDLSVSHQLRPDLSVHLDLSYTQWDTLKELVIKNEGATGSLAEIKEELDWKNSLFYSVGAEWQWQKNISLRGGIGIDKTPVSDGHRSVRVPSEDRTVISLGGSYLLNEKMSIDVGYMFLKEKTAVVDVSKISPVGPLSYSAEYSGKAHLVGVQLNLKL
ncbi:OmpP1/FadL family transporter [Agitococcus lubricus]|uniref:Long-chain fatty acid transport protein n=1 Tax=Agitococcus lubricus TaxID=1077255 RepID=A0A2T5J267_9GAMM|nr:outer membrane protein transport protein [Agitococcus lubricus]PTQ90618.1 long-chain fatty acid transport protein [Agitococcus lubricus]